MKSIKDPLSEASCYFRYYLSLFGCSVVWYYLFCKDKIFFSNSPKLFGFFAAIPKTSTLKVKKITKFILFLKINHTFVPNYTTPEFPGV